MIFNVPQFIEVEDKIAGPFTAKQLLWMFAMGVVLLILWFLFDKTAFIVVAIPVGLIFLALAFYRPQGIPFIKFVIFGLMFLFQPKIYSWKRVPQVKKEKPREKNKTSLIGIKKEKKMAPEYIKSLARTIDSGGREADPQIIKARSETVKKEPKKLFSFFKKPAAAQPATTDVKVKPVPSTSATAVTAPLASALGKNAEPPSITARPAPLPTTGKEDPKQREKMQAAAGATAASKEGKIIFTKY